MRILRSIVGLVVLMTLGLTLVAPDAQAVDAHLTARLHGSPRFAVVTAHSNYERTSTHRAVEVRMSGATRLAGWKVVVYVNFTRVGTMLVSFTGHAQRVWDTDNGQSVPIARVGDPVRIRSLRRAFIASGTYFRAGS